MDGNGSSLSGQGAGEPRLDGRSPVGRNFAPGPRGAHPGDVESASFELKGSVSPLTVIRLRTTDVAAVERDLWDRVEQVPQMFLNAPIVVDVGGLEQVRELSFPRLVQALRRCQVVPVGVTNVPPDLGPRAAEAGLGVLALGAGRARREPTPPPLAEAPPPEPAGANPTLVVRQPVRGGQVIYAQRADLLIMAAVNPGAQVIADGNVHVYGNLRGRALAGASGNTDARIFTQCMAAEMVCICGSYLMADEIPEPLLGRPAQVFFKDERARLAPLP